MNNLYPAKSKILASIGAYAYSMFLVLILNACSDLASPQEQSKLSPVSRQWIGPNYWANPLQDWEIKNGSIICNVAKPGRNLHLLSYEIGSQVGNFSTDVDLQVLNDLPASEDNWLGFELGKKGQFNDYRDDAIYGKGIQVGLTTSGLLFVRNGSEEVFGEKSTPPDLLTQGLSLALLIDQPVQDTAVLTLNVSNAAGELLSTLSYSDWDHHEYAGSFALVSHFDPADKDNTQQGAQFTNWKYEGSKLIDHQDRQAGPLLFSQYTQQHEEVKMTVQMMPVGKSEDQQAAVEVLVDGQWVKMDTSQIDTVSRTAHFRFTNPSPIENAPFRVCYTYQDQHEMRTDTLWGTLKAEPQNKDELVIAALSCNRDLGFPAQDLVQAIKYHNPDLLFFGGDQLYEGAGGFGTQRSPVEKATLDYLRKWYQFGWAYGEVINHYPTVTITDDHDVYHGNLWGEGGRSVPDSLGRGAKAQDFGGYKMPPEWVNSVQKTQTWHLPDPVDPEPVAQGIGVYFTELQYAGVSFAIAEDRKWKSAPKSLLPEAGIYNGWPSNKSWDAQTQSRVENATLLGERQQGFLEDWSSKWRGGTWMKVLLSQTIFHNIGTLPKSAINDEVVPTLKIMKPGEYPPDDRPVSDFDTNGWPQQGRDRAIRTLRKGFAFHIAGDQHLGSTSQYGVDEYNDGGYAFCVPAISNIWPRRWFPSQPGLNPIPADSKITGDFLDGFGNKMTVHAVANPIATGQKPIELYDRAAGYGIVRLNRSSRDITMECWPRFQDLTTGEGKQYTGWPITINQLDNYGKEAIAYLPEVIVEGMENPVIEVISESDGKLIYSLRINGNTFRPKVYRQGTYRIRLGDPDTAMKEVENIEGGAGGKILFSF